MITIIESLPKLLLSEAIRKIRDLFPPAAKPSNVSLNFSLRLDLTNTD